jgi:DnaJ-class molecular chaperone
MIDPRDPSYQVSCPNCKGKGIVTIPCPYPADVEPDCEECEHFGKCDTDYYCDTCEGDGYISERERKSQLMEKNNEN